MRERRADRPRPFSGAGKWGKRPIAEKANRSINQSKSAHELDPRPRGKPFIARPQLKRGASPMKVRTRLQKGERISGENWVRNSMGRATKMEIRWAGDMPQERDDFRHRILEELWSGRRWSSNAIFELQGYRHPAFAAAERPLCAGRRRWWQGICPSPQTPSPGPSDRLPLPHTSYGLPSAPAGPRM